ncbi:MAG: large subunit ribosomal protein [Patescibacteria group bacterium]|nr:large subunit ribosomal protein [Patescibacteria group bacterium]
MKFILGKKLGMTTLFDETKGALNVTLIECGKNVITLQRTEEKDGYMAIQVEAAKNSRKTVRHEFRLDRHSRDGKSAAQDMAKFALESELGVEQFAVGDRVSISGVTKAKGFQGVVKRHGFAGGWASHGGKHDLRKPGSIGSTFPEHVVKGRRMAGRMGGDNCTVRNLTISYIDAEKGLIGVRGAVPGVNGRIVEVMSLK